MQDLHVWEVCARPVDEPFQVGLADCADWVDVGAGTVVFGQITAEGFVDVCAAENEQRAWGRAAANEREGLGEEVGEDHAETSLDVLKCEVFGLGAAMNFVF